MLGVLTLNIREHDDKNARDTFKRWEGGLVNIPIFSALIWDIREGVEVKNICLNLWTFAIMFLICSDMLMECLLWIFLC